MLKRFETHVHSEYSNLRLVDCINKPEALIDYAIEQGLAGIAFTDHECISGSIRINKYAQQIAKEHPDFKVAIGNEIYLCSSRESGQKYYHFILIAKNKMGHRALRELSSKAWMNSYHDRRMERVPTLYNELEDIVHKYPGSLIATTACIGGQLGQQILRLHKAEVTGDNETRNDTYQNIVDFLCWCKELFGDDFYLEVAPGCSKEQIIVNQRMVHISNAFDIDMVIGTDAHFMRKEDRYIHKAYLNSKEGDREVDSFYEYSYLQTEEEIFQHLAQSAYSREEVEKLFENSIKIYDKIENYSLLHKQSIPKVEVEDYPKIDWNEGWINGYPTLKAMFQSDDKVERYWVNQCIEALEKKVGERLDYSKYMKRLEEEARTKKIIGEKLETNMFLYPVTLQHYVDMFWECGSMVGAGRGSACAGLNHYLLGVTQLDPIEWNLPWFRYMNEERVELGDIDLDLCPSKRPLIIKKIKEERGKNFNANIDEQSKENLGCTLIATFGTEGTRSTILTACRGYRSKDCPDGIDVDTAQYMSSLIPAERGFLWPLKDAVNGNKDKDRKPIAPFINEVNKYPGLLDIMFGIEGLISRRGSHASGVILFDEDPYEHCCFMRTPKGEIITQYDLHDAEAAGSTKYDFLVTEIQDKLVEWIKMLQKNNEIDSSLTLRQVYDKYLHPSILPIHNEKVWNAIGENKVLNIFQFDSDVGSQAAKRIKPRSITELSDANGLMRLMTSEKGQETPMDKYVRFKNNIQLWYNEMDREGLTKEEQRILEPYFKSSYGVPPSQEQMMLMLMDENICHFTLAEGNAARKIVGKKQMSKIPELKEKVLSQASSPALGEYVWKYGIGPQMGYSFSIIHALAYSFIGFQTAYAATNWNPVYWNTACLIVNSGSLDTEDEDKENGTNYAKMARAIGDTISKGIKVSPVDINRSASSFEPDAENNEILFGMKGLNRVGDDVIKQIIAGRPYTGIKDFMKRCPLNKTAMVSLIKSGAFDKLDAVWASKIHAEPRIAIMAYYVSQICEPKKRLTLQNFNGLLERGIIPDKLELQKKIFLFNKKLKKQKNGDNYILTIEDVEFFNKYLPSIILSADEHLHYCINQKIFDKLYKEVMDGARDWLKEHQGEALQMLNDSLFEECWQKYASGNVSAWEMESLCFYHHPHELANVDNVKYGIKNFFAMSESPQVDKFFKRNGKEIPLYKINRIAGTVIAKNDIKSTISLLTTTGVVNVKFNKEYFAMFNRQLSEMQEDGTRKVAERGWFTRGTMLLVQGFRRADTWVAKTYKSTGGHQLYKITEVNGEEIVLTHDRYGMEDEGK